MMVQYLVLNLVQLKEKMKELKLVVELVQWMELMKVLLMEQLKVVEWVQYLEPNWVQLKVLYLVQYLVPVLHIINTFRFEEIEELINIH